MYSCLSDVGKIVWVEQRLSLNVTSHSLSGSDCISDSPSGSDCFERRVAKQMTMTECEAIARNLPIRYLYSHHVFVALDLLCSCIYACIFPNSHTVLFSIFHLTIFHKRKKIYGMFYSVRVLVMCYCWSYLMISTAVTPKSHTIHM